MSKEISTFKELNAFVERVGIKSELETPRGIKVSWKYHNGDLIIILREDEFVVAKKETTKKEEPKTPDQ